MEDGTAWFLLGLPQAGERLMKNHGREIHGYNIPPKLTYIMVHLPEGHPLTAKHIKQLQEACDTIVRQMCSVLNGGPQGLP